MNYNEFLLKKQSIIRNKGFDPSNLPDILFPFQRDITAWSIRKGKSAIWAGCGLGKTLMQLSWADQVGKHTGGRVLIFAPLAVSAQTKKEGEKISVDVSMEDMGIIRINNYEQLHNIDCSLFSGVVLDECFPPDTPIDFFNIDNSLTCKYIKDISEGDRIFNANGEDHVKKIYKRQINRAIQIYINGRNITCSENHPFFTMYGWRSAQDLRPGDNIMATGTAMRLVRGDLQTEVFSEQEGQVLREILLSEMENEHSRALCESPHEGSLCKKRDSEIKMVKKRISIRNERDRENNNLEPYEKQSNEGEGICYIAEDEAQTFRAWGEWSRDDIATANNDGCIIRKLDSGICYITGKTSTRFSDMLQSRLRESRLKNSDRSGRPHPQIEERQRLEKGQKAGFFGVESVEVLELGHPDLERYRDEDGNIYFYDIKAERHPSFSVNGCLVHNSSILKNFAGKFKNKIIESFYNTPYKLCCSATPSPNDFIEIGNHAEFLNICSRSEMLSTYFVHDSGCTQKWRLKGHAEKEFFKWLSTWAVMVEKPSDLGYDDNGFILPELKITQHIVKSDACDGYLFPEMANTLNERRQARKESIRERCELAASLSDGSTDPWLYWCDLNDESTLLTKLIDGATEITGSMKNDIKEDRFLGFSTGKYNKIVTKAKIAQFGLNWQHCNNMVFVGLSDSFEAYYQAVRRCWRFGQKKPVNVHIVISEKEGNVLANIKEKEMKASIMLDQMVKHMSDLTKSEINNSSKQTIEYKPIKRMEVPTWMLSNKKMAKTG